MFHDSIVVGRAVIPWAVKIKNGNLILDEGWALPGGQQTKSKSEAKRVAASIDKMMTAAAISSGVNRGQ